MILLDVALVAPQTSRFVPAALETWGFDQPGSDGLWCLADHPPEVTVQEVTEALQSWGVLAGRVWNLDGVLTVWAPPMRRPDQHAGASPAGYPTIDWHTARLVSDIFAALGNDALTALDLWRAPAVVDIVLEPRPNGWHTSAPHAVPDSLDSWVFALDPQGAVHAFTVPFDAEGGIGSDGRVLLAQGEDVVALEIHMVGIGLKIGLISSWKVQPPEPEAP